jgi:PAS domain S-box-containing protein
MNPAATLLVVDGATDSLVVLRAILTGAGYRLRLADRGELALAAARAYPPDLILLDLQLPDLEGLEVCRRLKADEQTRHIPVILLSAVAGVEQWVQGLRLGAADHIGKPFQPEELLMRVRTQLELGRAQAVAMEAAELRALNALLEQEVVRRQQAEADLRQSLEVSTRAREDLLRAQEERLRVDTALRESDANQRALLESATQSILLIEPQGTLLALNEIAARRLGRTRGEMLGGDIYSFLPSDVAVQRRARVAEVVAQGRAVRFEDERLGRWIDQVLVPVRDDTGQVVRVAIFGEDITERRRTEATLQARARLLEFATKHSLEELLVATLDEAEILTGSMVGFYHFLEADQKTLSLQAWSTRTTREMCRAEGKGRHYHVAEAGVWVDCIRERRPVLHNDYASLAHRRGLPAGHAPVVREMVVPVFRANLIVAILGVGNKATDYTEADVEAVTRLADLAWDIALRKRDEIELRRRNEELVRFNDVMVGRELRMLELKQEVNELCQRQDLPPRYDVDVGGADGPTEPGKAGT